MINMYDCSSCEAIAYMVKKQLAVVEAYFDRVAKVKSNPVVADSV
jgi:hypothetical protein